MSSECFEFKCLSVQGDKARFKMISFEEEKPLNKSFYLMLLLETYEHAREAYLDSVGSLRAGSLSEAEYLAKWDTSPGGARLEELHTLLNGRSVPVTPEQLEEYRADSRAFDAKYNMKTKGGGSRGTYCHVRTMGDEHAFVVVAQQEILSVTPYLLGEPGDLDGREGLWSDVEFQVANPELLAYVVPGATWESALYELNDDYFLGLDA
jgi:hypothetical protein